MNNSLVLEIPKEWSWGKVNDFTLEHKQGYYTNNSYTTSGTLLIRITDLCNPKIDYTQMPLLNISKNEYEQFKVEVGDFLFARSGAIGRYGIVKKKFPAVFASYLIRFRFDNKIIDTSYFGYVYESDICKKQLNYITQGSSNININAENIKGISIPLPPLPEQIKIATILTSINNVIEKTEAEIKKVQSLKKAMMLELLTKGIKHIEFKDSPWGKIPKDWKILKASDVIHRIESGWSPQCETIPPISGEWGVLKTTSVTWDGFNYKESKKLPEYLKPRPEIQAEVGDVLVTRAGPSERVGVVAYVSFVPDKIMISDKLIRIKTKLQMCMPEYFSIWLSGDVVQKYFSERTTGLAQSQTNISQDIIKNAPLILPTKTEQKNISNMLFSIDSRIKIIFKKHEQMQNLKKALMQDLLTGKVRVKVY